MSILVSIFAVGLIVALHEFGHMIVARRFGMTVLRYSIGFFHPLFSWRSEKSGTVYQMGMLPLGGFVQIRGMNPLDKNALDDPASYTNKPLWQRALVLVAGPFSNLVVAWVLMTIVYAIGVEQYADEAGVGKVEPGMPADRAGLEAGDVIEKLNDETLKTWGDLYYRLEAHPGIPVRLQVKRGDTRFIVEVFPDNVGGRGKIGIYQPMKNVSWPLYIAPIKAVKQCVRVTGDFISTIVRFASGNREKHEKIMGPVRTVQMAAVMYNSQFMEFLLWMSYLSLALFLFNLLPLPALDGGRAAFLIYEAVTKRRLPPKVDVLINGIGFVLLMGLLLFVTYMEIWGG